MPEAERVGGRETGVERFVLGEERDAPADGGSAGLGTEHAQCATGRPEQPRRQVEQRALAGPARPDEGGDSAGRQGEVAVAQRPAAAEPVPEPRRHQGLWIRHVPPSPPPPAFTNPLVE
ncbi:hypothetical protein GCM10010357_24880 [Streptomyces luteireticuli]|uniref:Uncharacterized protein n=1 Tax=Streptomyces luteireticuli TaxID=173858 RepID=A0ABN0YNQ4_9ACTN